MTNKKIFPNGFSLIELLIVITIISVLSVIGFVVYTGVSKSGRDTKRQTDLKNIQSALEEYFSDQFNYPLRNVDTSCGYANVKFDPALDCSLKINDAKVYMSTLPVEPVSSRPQYYYEAFLNSSRAPCDNGAGSNKCGFYCLYTSLETPLTGFAMPTGCTGGSPTYNFAVTIP